jgi:glycerophosphoryl diester phosphodiesterase
MGLQQRPEGAIMQVFGHRGAAGHSPENTLPSIRQALAMNVDGIEFDVRLTRDRIPVVIHDETLDRTTSASGRVNQLSLSEMRQLLPDPHESVPTLSEVLREIGTATRINAELKEIDTCSAAIAALLSTVQAHLIRPELVLVTSFDLAAVKEFRRQTSCYAVGLLTNGLPDDSFWNFARQVKASSANIDLASVDEAFVETAHQNELEVMVYTVNSLEDASQMSGLGVDAIVSDFPDRVQT